MNETTTEELGESAIVEHVSHECACAQCVSACKRNPGWLAPEDAVKAMDAGYGERLMLDWLEACDEVGNKDPLFVIAAASVGYGGDWAPVCSYSILDLVLGVDVNKGACTFLKDNLCEIHTSGFKPLQCRVGSACGTPHLDNFDMGRLWDTPEGKAAVDRFVLLSNIDLSDYPGECWGIDWSD